MFIKPYDQAKMIFSPLALAFSVGQAMKKNASRG
jgi:hypothetical protein